MRATRASLLARTSSVAAVAVLAGGGVIATATVADAATGHHHALKPTTLSIRNKPIAHARHHADALTGVLRSRRKDVAGETIYLDSRTGRKPRWAMVAKGTTGSNGAVMFTVAPTARTQYKLIFRGDSSYRRSHSNVITLKPVKKG